LFSAPPSHIQRDRKGKGWADMKATTADNTYTGKAALSGTRLRLCATPNRR